MTAPLRLTFAVMLLCSASAWPLSVRQEQPTPATSPDQNTQGQTQSPANAPTQPAPPTTSNPAAPTTSTGEKASPPPKPPVLKHRKRKVHHSTSAKKPVPNSNGEPSKVVVRNGGAKEGSAQLTPAVNPAQAKSQNANTASLLAETNEN